MASENVHFDINYYFDTCIWRDHNENRTGKGGRPLGEIASRLIMKFITERIPILYSEFITRELKIDYSDDEINDMFNILHITGNLIKVPISKQIVEEASKLHKARGISLGDCLHALLARSNNSIIVTQNMKDFEKIADIVISKKPEHLL